MTQVSSLYLHVPFCKHLCNYCDFYKRKLEAPAKQFEDFHQFLLASERRHSELMQEHGVSWAPLETIYLGGGTPSLWGVPGAEFFKENLLKVNLHSDVEFTMEVDPGTWSEEMLQSWQAIGLNRISIGTQTLDPKFLKVMDRVHSLEDTFALLEYMRQKEWNYSLDFLLGVPYSREQGRNIQSELEALLKYSPKHISLYILNARSKYPLIQSMPDDEFIREEYLFVSEFLKQRGFHHYEVSNFALPGYESRHNQKYWRGENVAALGPTGTGYFSLGKEALRYKWKTQSPQVELEHLGPDELSLEQTYLSLRTSEGWVPHTGMKQLIDKWVNQDYAQVILGKVHLTSLGYLMLDSLMDDIFRWEAHPESL